MFSEEAKQEINRLIDEKLEQLLKYTLQGLQPVNTKSAEASGAQTPFSHISSPGSAPASTPTWQPMTPTQKGPWEQTSDLQHPEVQAILGTMALEGKTVVNIGSVTYWKVVRDGKLVGLGRRAK